ncbi:MAG: phosphoribulokinase [Methanomicrobiales archaeon]|jgi:phosphoribulokinase|nr:phosphoribulokinase [Methanomicrobiales archaeon]
MKKQENFQEVIRQSSLIFLIGVAGDSGSGKSTFTKAISDIFGDELVTTIAVDDYHIYDRKTRSEMGITPLAHSANNLKLLEENLKDLKAGNAVLKPVYLHDHGTFGEPELLSPKKFIIVEGLHPYATDTLRKLYDYTIFVDPERDVKYDWKIRRDMKKRNYDKNEVLDEIIRREPDYIQYVLPQRARADSVIQINYSSYGKEEGEKRNVYRVMLSMPEQEYCFEDIELNIDLCDLFKKSSHDFSLACTSHSPDSRKMRALVVDGELMPDTIHKIERQIEYQTGVAPINIFRNQEHITGTDLVRLVLSWQIINGRIALSNPSYR